MCKGQGCQSPLCHPEANHLSLPDSSRTVRELCGQKYGVQWFYIPTYPTNQPTWELKNDHTEITQRSRMDNEGKHKASSFLPTFIFPSYPSALQAKINYH
jgi:hypothetical protein